MSFGAAVLRKKFVLCVVVISFELTTRNMPNLLFMVGTMMCIYVKIKSLIVEKK